MEILWLGHADCHDVNRAGAKAAHLSRLAASYRIPPGFCLTTAAYAQWAECPDSEHPASSTPSLPPALYQAVASAYRDLADMCGSVDLSVAVRSSAVDGEVLPRMGDLWEQEWLPSILPGLEKGHTTDYAALSNEELVHTLDEMLREFRERWTIHGYVNFVVISAS